MKKNILKTLALLLVAGGTAACDPETEKADYDRLPSGEALPAVSEATLTNDRYAGEATVSFSVEADESNPASEVGLLLSIGTEPELGAPGTKKLTATATGGNTYSIVLNNIQNGADYFVRPYAYTPNGIAYGSMLTFKGDVETFEGWEPGLDESLDFTSASNAGAFTSTTLDPSQNAAGWTAVPMGLLGIPGYGWFSGLLDPVKLFSQGRGALAGYSCRNVLTYETDLTGRVRPELNITLYNLEKAFGLEGYAANVRVYASEEPVTSEATLRAATLIGTTDIQDELGQFTFAIPNSFKGRTYISIYHEAIYDDDLSDYGVVLLGFDLYSLKAPAGQPAAASLNVGR